MCWLNYNVLKLGSDKYFESLPTSQLSYNVYKLGSDKYFDISLMCQLQYNAPAKKVEVLTD
jgi:hypothetical protein